jgi:hypothetical protein
VADLDEKVNAGALCSEEGRDESTTISLNVPPAFALPIERLRHCDRTGASCSRPPAARTFPYATP